MNQKEISQLLYQLKWSNQRITQLFEERVGMSITRYEILRRLLTYAPCNQQFLQQDLQIDQAAITRQLKILEENHYIIRQRNAQNQREILVETTEKARQDLLLAPPGHHLQMKQEMEAILTLEETQTLENLLDKLVNGIEIITYKNKEKS